MKYKVNLLKIVLSLSVAFLSASEWNWKRGVNDVLNIQVEAASIGRGGVILAVPFSPNGWSGNAAKLVEAESNWLSYSHIEFIAESYLDKVNFVFPLDQGTNALAVSATRYSQEGIPLVDEFEKIEGDEYRVFTVEEWVLDGSYGHQFNNLQLGMNLAVIYRNLNQLGLGIRGDFSFEYNLSRLRLAGRVPALLSSVVRWESELVEYEEPDLELGIGYEVESKYFYGDFSFALETKGLFQERSRSVNELNESRIYDSPLNWIERSAFGVQYRSEVGVLLRTGWKELVEWQQITLGAGFAFQKTIEIDYSWERDPELGAFHRISVSIVPKKMMTFF